MSFLDRKGIGGGNVGQNLGWLALALLSPSGAAEAGAGYMGERRRLQTEAEERRRQAERDRLDRDKFDWQRKYQQGSLDARGEAARATLLGKTRSQIVSMHNALLRQMGPGDWQQSYMDAWANAPEDGAPDAPAVGPIEAAPGSSAWKNFQDIQNKDANTGIKAAQATGDVGFMRDLRGLSYDGQAGGYAGSAGPVAGTIGLSAARILNTQADTAYTQGPRTLLTEAQAAGQEAKNQVLSDPRFIESKIVEPGRVNNQRYYSTLDTMSRTGEREALLPYRQKLMDANANAARELIGYRSGMLDVARDNVQLRRDGQAATSAGKGGGVQTARAMADDMESAFPGLTAIKFGSNDPQHYGTHADGNAFDVLVPDAATGRRVAEYFKSRYGRTLEIAAVRPPDRLNSRPHVHVRVKPNADAVRYPKPTAAKAAAKSPADPWKGFPATFKTKALDLGYSLSMPPREVQKSIEYWNRAAPNLLKLDRRTKKWTVVQTHPRYPEFVEDLGKWNDHWDGQAAGSGAAAPAGGPPSDTVSKVQAAAKNGYTWVEVKSQLPRMERAQLEALYKAYAAARKG